jgi:hypothetical protein
MEAKELKLAIVALRDVVLHEEIERKRVEKIQARLQSDRVLKNPPIVTRVEDGGAERYIVLDGASRTSALRALQVPDVLVQIVDYHSPKLKLESWHHLLLDLTPARLRQELDTVTCVAMEEMSETRAKHELEARNIVAYVKFSDGHLVGLKCNNDLTEQAHALNEVVRAYEAKVELYRVATTDFESHLADPKRLAAIMVFPRYKPEEIVQIALSGARVPMGITRHIIPGRALRVNLPLDVLENAQSLDEKNAWLDTWLEEKMKNRNVRFYQEPVFLFDE